jgi:TPR repeat protein
MSTSLPDIQTGLNGPSGPSGPSGPEDPTTPSPGRVVRDERKAVETWRKAAELGSTEAQNNLAIALYNGRGVARNAAEAVAWWKKAADSGDAEAQFNLASCIFSGHGTTADVPAAIVLMRAAMSQGHVEAMCFLAGHYAEGTAGLDKDLDRAFELYSQASQHGSEEAQYRLWVVADQRKREAELENLNSRMSKIHQGFIALQLERAANDEITHSYAAAGVGLSPGKALETQGARARVAQARRAEREIRTLRDEVETLAAQGTAAAEERDALASELAALRARVAELEAALGMERARAEALDAANRTLAAADAEQRAQVQQLLGENQELETVAAWAKAQRVDALQQALATTVKSTMVEQDAREKRLRAEIGQLRVRLEQAGAGAGAGADGAGASGGPLQALEDVEEQSRAMLRRMRRDMLVQEVLLGEVLAGVRDAELHEQIELLKECLGAAEDSEGELGRAIEEVLDHVDSESGLDDAEAAGLRESLTRVVASIGLGRARTPGTPMTPGGTRVPPAGEILQENRSLREKVLRLSPRIRSAAALAAAGARGGGGGGAPDGSLEIEVLRQEVAAMLEHSREHAAQLSAAASSGLIEAAEAEELSIVEAVAQDFARQLTEPGSPDTPASRSVAAESAGESSLDRLRRLDERRREDGAEGAEASGASGTAGSPEAATPLRQGSRSPPGKAAAAGAPSGASPQRLSPQRVRGAAGAAGAGAERRASAERHRSRSREHSREAAARRGAGGDGVTLQAIQGLHEDLAKRIQNMLGGAAGAEGAAAAPVAKADRAGAGAEAATAAVHKLERKLDRVLASLDVLECAPRPPPSLGGYAYRGV